MLEREATHWADSLEKAKNEATLFEKKVQAAVGKMQKDLEALLNQETSYSLFKLPFWGQNVR